MIIISNQDKYKTTFWTWLVFDDFFQFSLFSIKIICKIIELNLIKFFKKFAKF